MDGELLLHQAMEERLANHKKTKTNLERELKNLPKGAIVERNGRYYHVYRKNKKQHMIRIKSDDFLNKLRKRKHIIKSLKKIDDKIKNCQSFLEKDQIYDPRQIALELPQQYRKVECPELWLPGDTDPEAWAAADYKQNPAPMENPSDTEGGRTVRSKSEAIIGTLVEHANLLHRYEQEMVMFGETFYPDFIILLPNRRRLIIYEHFGKMDDPKYVLKTMHKLEVYSRFGLRLGFNFFFTIETSTLPFSYRGAKEKLKEILAQDVI